MAYTVRKDNRHVAAANARAFLVAAAVLACGRFAGGQTINIQFGTPNTPVYSGTAMDSLATGSTWNLDTTNWGTVSNLTDSNGNATDVSIYAQGNASQNAGTAGTPSYMQGGFWNSPQYDPAAQFENITGLQPGANYDIYVYGASAYAGNSTELSLSPGNALPGTGSYMVLDPNVNGASIRDPSYGSASNGAYAGFEGGAVPTVYSPTSDPATSADKSNWGVFNAVASSTGTISLSYQVPSYDPSTTSANLNAIQIQQVPARYTSKYLGTTWQDTAYPSFGGFFTQLTPENDGKWGPVEGAGAGQFSWSNLDAMYSLAAQRGMLIKQHNMIAAGQQPGWVTSANAAQAESQWFSAYAQRYGSQVNMIDVVNEPLQAISSNSAYGAYNPVPYASGLPGGLSNNGWIVSAYQLARQDFPNAKLLINDYGILSSTTNTEAYMKIIEQLKSQNLIDGIGLEAHFLENTSASTIQYNLNLLGSLGIPIYITEYDINQASDQAQLQQMETQFPIFWNDPMVKGVTMWDFAYGHTWQANANLLYANGDPRPAMQWLEHFMNPNGTVLDSGAAVSVGAGGGGTGPIAIDFGGGTLDFAAPGVRIGNTLQVNSNNAYINISGQSNVGYSGNITGGGSLTVENTGNYQTGHILAFTGYDTAAGATTVGPGAFLLLAAVPGSPHSGVLTGSVNVSSGATLGGTGTVGGTITSNGFLAPGYNSTAQELAPGFAAGSVLKSGALTIRANSYLGFDLGTPNLPGGAGGNDFIQTGNLFINNGVSVYIGSAGGLGVGRYDLIGYSGWFANSGDLGTWTVYGPSGYSYGIGVVSGDVYLTVATSPLTGSPAVPEPTAVLFLALGGSLAALARCHKFPRCLC